MYEFQTTTTTTQQQHNNDNEQTEGVKNNNNNNNINLNNDDTSYYLAALPHHSWCFIHKNICINGKILKDGLEKYYSLDNTLKYVHKTLYQSLKPMIKDRLYNALILVLQQRGLIQEERIKKEKNPNYEINKKQEKCITL